MFLLHYSDNWSVQYEQSQAEILVWFNFVKYSNSNEFFVIHCHYAVKQDPCFTT